MATHKSAEKRHRQNLKRREKNRSAKSTIRTAVKKVLAAGPAKDTTTTENELKSAISLLAKAATKRTLHKNNAKRRISRLQKKANTIKKTTNG